MDTTDIIKSIYQKISTNQQSKTKSTQMISYECEKCQDTGIIWNAESHSGRTCECQEKKRYEKILKNCGISEYFRTVGFKEFVTETEFQKKAKAMAVEYTKNFQSIEKERNNSIAFLGNCGSGKTHLSLAIANNLMTKNIAVLYMPYREAVTKIKQVITDEYSYNEIINKYKTARVLLIDDFAKGKVTESDVNIMFEIVNYRYLQNKPIIISSELVQNNLLDFDEAVGSRIIEMCKGRTAEAIGIENNYRLKGI